MLENEVHLVKKEELVQKMEIYKSSSKFYTISQRCDYISCLF